MTRALLVVIALLSWAGLIATSLVILTPDADTALTTAATSELEAQLRTLSVASAELERELLATTREAAAILRPGATFDPPEALPPGKGKRKPPKDVAPPEPTQDRLRVVEAELTSTLLTAPGRWFALVNGAGEVVLASGEGGWKAGTHMKNHPLVVDGMSGISRVAAQHGDGTTLLAAAPSAGRDGGANAVLVVGRSIDASFCQELSAAMAQAPVALGRGTQLLCKTEGAGATTTGTSVLPRPIEAPLLFVDTSKVGSLVLGAERVVPVLELNASVAKDLRPAYTQLSQWQQRVIAVWLLGLVPLLVLLAIAWLIAVAPAQTIANHLALLQQGNKVAPLSERKFSGGFRRIVKNLDTLLERKDSRQGPQSLAPISQLLQQQSGDDSSEFRLESIKQVNKQLPRMPEPPLPSAEPPAAEPSRPPLQPLTSGLSALSDSIFDETAKTGKHTPIMREEEPQMPPSAPFDAAPQGISKLNTLSESETESGLGALKGMPKTAPFPPAPPVETPWHSETTSIGLPPAMPDIPPQPVDPDEAHFREVFQQFLQVREQCGESTDNLTYDKFVDKLRKSRDQVMQKQHTRNVRFQVYVKDGKAALKAVAAARS